MSSAIRDDDGDGGGNGASAVVDRNEYAVARERVIVPTEKRSTARTTAIIINICFCGHDKTKGGTYQVLSLTIVQPLSCSVKNVSQSLLSCVCVCVCATQKKSLLFSFFDRDLIRKP